MALPLGESGKPSPMSLLASCVRSKEQRSPGFVGLFLPLTLQLVPQALGFVSSGSLAFVVPFLVGFLAVVLYGI